MRVGKDPSGKRRRVQRAGFHTKKDAEQARRDVLSDATRNRYVDRSKRTVADYLQQWLVAVKGRVKESSWEAMELHIRLYISPRIGHIDLQQLSRQHVKGLYASLAEGGRERGAGGLAAKTVWNVHLTLHLALADAVEDRILATNPSDGAMKAPRTGTVTAWTAEGLRTFLDEVGDDRLFAFWRLAAFSGMRRGGTARPGVAGAEARRGRGDRPRREDGKVPTDH
ncbi:MAG: Arm DNA-binding domain-containing protein [Actinomycetota bacterium]|nr:Arm DNA-binding domain-containing protein [Actinomycetota bacterium]